MEKVDMISSSDSSPRSTLKWKEYWGNYESGRLSPAKSKRLVERPSSNNFDGPKTPPPQLERRQFRPGSLSRSVDLETYGGSCGSPLGPKSANATKGRPVAPVAEEPCGNSPPTPTLGAFQLGVNIKRGRQAQSFELPERIWRQDPTTIKNSSLPSSSSGSSSGCLSVRDDDDSNSLGTSDEDSVRNVASWWSSAAARSRNARPKNRMQVTSSATDSDLNSIKSCVKRAIDLGIKVQHCDSLEVAQLRQDKANAEGEVMKWAELNRALEEQVSTLRGEVQTVQWERELDVLAFNKAIQGLEMERNTLMQAARDEKKRREKLQSEVDCVLSLLVEEKQNLESERIDHDTALRNERKKAQSVRRERDAAVKALQDATQKLNIERDAMVIAMRDLNSSLDLERDANLSSMRRSSVDMATMMSGYRLTGSRKNSFSRDDDAPYSRPLSRRNSRV